MKTLLVIKEIREKVVEVEYDSSLLEDETIEEYIENLYKLHSKPVVLDLDSNTITAITVSKSLYDYKPDSTLNLRK